MKVLVIIPSLNEADNIARVVSTVDAGLKKYFPAAEGLLLNVDSKSTDKTRKVFLGTPTSFVKKSVVPENKYQGKGANIHQALSLYGRWADVFLMLDADITSINESWILSFLQPVANNKADFVAPLYTRNRYEGNTTNHFSSPLIYACFGIDILQPIAGDFCFNQELAKAVLKNIDSPSDFGYGIDTLITLTAVLNRCRIRQEKIGRKIHKPSFSKIVPMFTQIITTASVIINQNRKEILNRLREGVSNIDCIKRIDDQYVKKPSEESIKKIWTLIEDKASRLKKKNFWPEKLKFPSVLGSEDWTHLLSYYLHYLLENKVTDSQIRAFSEEMLISYLLRVLGYFEQIEKLSSSEVDSLLDAQEKLLREKLQERIALKQD